MVAPASTLHNWQQEVSRFVPQFKVCGVYLVLAVYSFEQRLKAGKYVMRQTSSVNDEASLFPSRSLPVHCLFTRFYCKDLNVVKMNQLK